MERIVLIGYGEAARAFTGAGLRAVAAYDCDPARRDGIAAHDTAHSALCGATLILSLVTADRALEAAQTCAPLLAAGALWCDLNSVAPDTKRAAAAVMAGADIGYCDVAIMAPVHPARLAVPLLLSGRDADSAVARLTAAGFADVRAVGDAVGRASSIKMIRSVMIKGVEALTAEMLLASAAAGVTDEILASLGADWAATADYNLGRMLLHGTRRAAEMGEVAHTLETLGIAPLMTAGTIRRQQDIGAIGAGSPAGLAAKLRLCA
jgi:3-hydroxyisobutyrate dehydrogenase-like beta-hydroxyacid dehydrogenase